MFTVHNPELRRRRFLLRRGLLIPLSLLALMGLFSIPTLEVKDVGDGRVLFVSRTSRGQIFEVRYIHSVEKTPVAGIFRVSHGNRIEVVESIFSSYGAGLPSDTSREDIIFEEERMRVRHHGVTMDRLRIFISPFTEQQFIHREGGIDLSSVGEGHIVEIKVKRTSLARYLARRFYDVFRGVLGQSSG